MSLPRNTHFHGLVRVIIATFVSSVLYELAYPSWTSHLTDAAYHTALAFLATTSAAWTYSLARNNDSSIHSLFMSGFVFRAIIHIGSAIEHILILETPWEKTQNHFTLDMFELTVFSVLASAALISQHHKVFGKIKLSTTPVIILCLLAGYGVFSLLILPTLSMFLVFIFGTIFGLISLFSFLSALRLCLKYHHDFDDYDIGWLFPSLVMLFLSCFPILFSVFGAPLVWIISMALQACGFFSFSLAVSVRFYTNSGMKIIPTYLLSAFTLLIAVIPLLAFIISEYFFPRLFFVDHGAYLIIHAGSATIAGLMATLLYGPFTNSLPRIHYPLVFLYLVWMISEIHILLFWRGPESVILGESLVPYLVGTLFSLISLVRINRWMRLQYMNQEDVDPRIWIITRVVLLGIVLWISHYIEDFLILSNPALEINPYPRSLLLIGNLASMFFFATSAISLFRQHRDWKRIDIIATGVLSIWIVPNILKGIFRDWTVGWWCAELILFFGVLWGPMILGILYLESMIKEDKSRLKASFYADLLVHDITNYHQAVLLSLGLLEMGIQDESILQQVLSESQRSLKRAEQLVRNVKHIGILEKTKTTNLHSIDLVYCVNEAFRQALETIDMQYVEFYCPYQEGEYYVQANDLLVDVFVNLIRNAIQYSPERKRIEINIEQGQYNNHVCWVVEIIDYGRGIEQKQKPLLFRQYSMDEFGPRLGLSFVHSIIDSYEGTVSVKDRVEGEHMKGSIFVLRIPVSSKEGVDR